MNEQDVSHLVATLRASEREARQIESPLIVAPWITLKDAYAIQARYVEARIGEGAVACGYKIGGGPELTYGVVFANTVTRTTESIAYERLIAPRVEVEIGFIMGARLAGPGVGAQDVVSATRVIVPCLEIIDSRIVGWGVAPVEIVVDNGHAARVVLGAPEVRPTSIAQQSDVILHRNGEIVSTGSASVRDFATSVAWLANSLSTRGGTIEPGEVVLSGAITPAVESDKGDEFHAVIGGLGEVVCRFV
jgi:2-keto-4-pentenoate hydratase